MHTVCNPSVCVPVCVRVSVCVRVCLCVCLCVCVCVGPATLTCRPWAVLSPPGSSWMCVCQRRMACLCPQGSSSPAPPAPPASCSMSRRRTHTPPDRAAPTPLLFTGKLTGRPTGGERDAPPPPPPSPLGDSLFPISGPGQGPRTPSPERGTGNRMKPFQAMALMVWEM